MSNAMTPEKLHEWADHPVTTALTKAEIHAAASAWQSDIARAQKAERELDAALATISQMSVMLGGTPFAALQSQEKPK